MDASCQAIQNRTTGSAAARLVSQPVASPAETDATLATPGVSTDQSGQATATKKRTDTERAAATDSTDSSANHSPVNRQQQFLAENVRRATRRPRHERRDRNHHSVSAAARSTPQPILK